MKFIIVLFSAIGLLSLLSCASNYKLNGYVYSHLDTLISHGTIRILSKKSNKEIVRKLDGSGKFTIKEIPDDSVTIFIESPNYMPFEKELVLTKNFPDTPPIFHLEPMKTKVYGRVVDQNGIPIEGAIVTTDITGSSVSDITDGNGKYEILLEGFEDDLEDEGGEINVSASKIGYSTGSRWGKAFLHKSSIIPEISLQKKKIDPIKSDGIGNEDVERDPGSFMQGVPIWILIQRFVSF